MIRIDTGYDGFLLLSEEKYKHLGFHLSELPQDIGLKERL
jgi:predicted aspartyl protease